jgi:hypothetical protein
MRLAAMVLALGVMFMLNALPGTAQNNDFAGNWNVVLDTQNLYMTMDNNLQAVIYNNANDLVRSADINGQMISSTHLMGTWIAWPNITDQGTVNIYMEGKDKFSGNLVWDDGIRATFSGNRVPK